MNKQDFLMYFWACRDKNLLPDNRTAQNAPTIMEEALNSVIKDELRNMFLNMQYYMEYCQMKGYVTPQEWLEKHKHFK